MSANVKYSKSNGNNSMTPTAIPATNSNPNSSTNVNVNSSNHVSNTNKYMTYRASRDMNKEYNLSTTPISFQSDNSYKFYSTFYANNINGNANYMDTSQLNTNTNRFSNFNSQTTASHPIVTTNMQDNHYNRHLFQSTPPPLNDLQLISSNFTNCGPYSQHQQQQQLNLTCPAQLPYDYNNSNYVDKRYSVNGMNHNLMPICNMSNCKPKHTTPPPMMPHNQITNTTRPSKLPDNSLTYSYFGNKNYTLGRNNSKRNAGNVQHHLQMITNKKEESNKTSIYSTTPVLSASIASQPTENNECKLKENTVKSSSNSKNLLENTVKEKNQTTIQPHQSSNVNKHELNAQKIYEKLILKEKQHKLTNNHSEYIKEIPKESKLFQDIMSKLSGINEPSRTENIAKSKESVHSNNQENKIQHAKKNSKSDNLISPVVAKIVDDLSKIQQTNSNLISSQKPSNEQQEQPQYQETKRIIKQHQHYSMYIEPTSNTSKADNSVKNKLINFNEKLENQVKMYKSNLNVTTNCDGSDNKSEKSIKVLDSDNNINSNKNGNMFNNNNSQEIIKTVKFFDDDEDDDELVKNASSDKNENEKFKNDVQKPVNEHVSLEEKKDDERNLTSLMTKNIFQKINELNKNITSTSLSFDINQNDAIANKSQNQKDKLDSRPDKIANELEKEKTSEIEKDERLKDLLVQEKNDPISLTSLHSKKNPINISNELKDKTSTKKNVNYNQTVSHNNRVLDIEKANQLYLKYFTTNGKFPFSSANLKNSLNEQVNTSSKSKENDFNGENTKEKAKSSSNKDIEAKKTEKDDDSNMTIAMNKLEKLINETLLSSAKRSNNSLSNDNGEITKFNLAATGITSTNNRITTEEIEKSAYFSSQSSNESDCSEIIDSLSGNKNNCKTSTSQKSSNMFPIVKRENIIKRQSNLVDSRIQNPSAENFISQEKNNKEIMQIFNNLISNHNKTSFSNKKEDQAKGNITKHDNNEEAKRKSSNVVQNNSRTTGNNHAKRNGKVFDEGDLNYLELLGKAANQNSIKFAKANDESNKLNEEVSNQQTIDPLITEQQQPSLNNKNANNNNSNISNNSSINKKTPIITPTNGINANCMLRKIATPPPLPHILDKLRFLNINDLISKRSSKYDHQSHLQQVSTPQPQLSKLNHTPIISPNPVNNEIISVVKPSSKSQQNSLTNACSVKANTVVATKPLSLSNSKESDPNQILHKTDSVNAQSQLPPSLSSNSNKIKNQATPSSQLVKKIFSSERMQKDSHNEEIKQQALSSKANSGNSDTIANGETNNSSDNNKLKLAESIPNKNNFSNTPLSISISDQKQNNAQKEVAKTVTSNGAVAAAKLLLLNANNNITSNLKLANHRKLTASPGLIDLNQYSIRNNSLMGNNNERLRPKSAYPYKEPTPRTVTKHGANNTMFNGTNHHQHLYNHYLGGGGPSLTPTPYDNIASLRVMQQQPYNNHHHAQYQPNHLNHQNMKQINPYYYDDKFFDNFITQMQQQQQLKLKSNTGNNSTNNDGNTQNSSNAPNVTNQNVSNNTNTTTQTSNANNKELKEPKNFYKYYSRENDKRKKEGNGFLMLLPGIAIPIDTDAGDSEDDLTSSTSN